MYIMCRPLKKQIIETWKKKNQFGVLIEHRHKFAPSSIFKRHSVHDRTDEYMIYSYFKEGSLYQLRDDVKLVRNSESLFYPKVIWKSGTKEWYWAQKLHRIDLPAIEYSNGDEEYWCFGKRHREDGPAVICGNKQYWFEMDKFIKEENKKGV
ncbi:MAG: hypothetical protein EKK64_06775 [Neisseriaceae bacterium]|nr:MAG: hypothetical protein EKK64_06775 [Neisseriaceae bacterium]